jgi:NADH-quinone oxidoreductase subunit E
MTNGQNQPIDLSAVDRLIARCGTRSGAAIPLLQGLMAEFGYLPLDAMKRIAEQTEIPAAHLYGVATFYRQFRLKPVGKNMVRVCLGTACHVQGGDRIHEVTRETLGLGTGEDTTSDLKFTVEAVACLGCCSLAPVVMVNTTTHGRLDGPKVRKLMTRYQKTEPAAS